MDFLKSAVGRKLVMAVTGAGMSGFIVIHLLGNLSVFAGPDGINAYAEKLHGLGPFVWVFRAGMLVLVSLHVFLGIRLTLENRTARPTAYAVKRHLRSTFGSRTMIWSGTIIGLFAIYHLLQFTFHVTNPALSPAANRDALGRPDVFAMVVAGLRNGGVSAAYAGSLAALMFHLMHGLQSSVQTFGLNSDASLPTVSAVGRVVAVILFVGFVLIPAGILAGLVRLR